MNYSLAVACLDFEASFKTESNNASSESNIFSVFNVESYIEDDNYNQNGTPTLMNQLSAKTRKKGKHTHTEEAFCFLGGQCFLGRCNFV